MSPDRSLVVSLHDVSPLTWDPCRKILSALDRIGISSCSLLVIPNHHCRAPFLKANAFCTWLRDCSGSGHEPVLHGYHHLRPRAPKESLHTRLTTRFYTADEGEFFDLSEVDTLLACSRALEEFSHLNLFPRGFIAPAWLLGLPAENALRKLGFEYTTRLRNVLRLQDSALFASQSLVWSTRSAWRRAASLIWNAQLFSRLKSTPLLRISIHPADVAHATVWKQIEGFLALALADRRPLTYAGWMQLQRPAPTNANLLHPSA
jgi:predicted deacetylase